MKTLLSALFLLSGLLHGVQEASAQTLREKIAARRAASTLASNEAPSLPAGARTLRDISYGKDPRQRFDVYLPAVTKIAPVIYLVHGGGWAHGNKDNPGLVGDKAAYWLAKGYVLVSVNYRMLPDTLPLDQARDVASGLAKAQQLAGGWGADPARFVLMGHSAGAHLVALLGASPTLLPAAGALRPLGVVSLDSAAMDVIQMMESPRHFKLYDRAFGKDRAYWVSTSPYHALTRQSLPLLAVCSSRRSDSCMQATALSKKAETLGVRIRVLPEDLSHMEINKELGQPSAYTEAVDAFLDSLVR